MTKGQLVETVYKKYDGEYSKRQVNEWVTTIFETIKTAVKTDKKFSYSGFGTWTVRTRKARKGRNPQTGETIKIKASKTVGFKPSLTLKQYV